MHVKPAEPRSVWDRPFAEFLRWCLAIAEVELKKLFRDPMELFSRAVQPVLWLVIFGQVFSSVKGIPIGNLSYLDYISPGILAQSVLFTAIFYGIAVIWERDLGIIHKLLVSPANRGALVFGKAVAAGFRGMVQAVVIYIIALALGISIRWEPFAIIGVCFGIFMGSAIFSCFSLVIACIVKTRERFLGIGQVLTMPLFFASNAIYPLELMPKWLQVIARINPLTYLVDALRGLMIQGGEHIHGLSLDFGVMTIVLVLMVAAAAKLYPSLVQ
jgi:ABC-2 type transport system permease protein